jgi:hypothetical protein
MATDLRGFSRIFLVLFNPQESVLIRGTGL